MPHHVLGFRSATLTMRPPAPRRTIGPSRGPRRAVNDREPVIRHLLLLGKTKQILLDTFKQRQQRGISLSLIDAQCSLRADIWKLVNHKMDSVSRFPKINRTPPREGFCWRSGMKALRFPAPIREIDSRRFRELKTP